MHPTGPTTEHEPCVDRITVRLEVRGTETGPTQQARLTYTLNGRTISAPIGDNPAGSRVTAGWRTLVVHHLPGTADLRDAHTRAVLEPLRDAYAAASRAAWHHALTDLRGKLVEFDDPVVTLLTRYSWHHNALPWTADLDAELRSCPYARTFDPDVLAVLVPRPAGQWLSSHWGLPGGRAPIVLPGHLDDTADTLIVMLRLWTGTGGTLQSLPGALTTARHATHTM